MKKYLLFRVLFFSSSVSVASAGCLYYLSQNNDAKDSDRNDSFREINENAHVRKIMNMIKEKLMKEAELLEAGNKRNRDHKKIIVLKNEIINLENQLKDMSTVLKNKKRQTRLVKLAKKITYINYLRKIKDKSYTDKDI